MSTYDTLFYRDEFGEAVWIEWLDDGRRLQPASGWFEMVHEEHGCDPRTSNEENWRFAILGHHPWRYGWHPGEYLHYLYEDGTVQLTFNGRYGLDGIEIEPARLAALVSWWPFMGWREDRA